MRVATAPAQERQEQQHTGRREQGHLPSLVLPDDAEPARDPVRVQHQAHEEDEHPADDGDAPRSPGAGRQQQRSAEVRLGGVDPCEFGDQGGGDEQGRPLRRDDGDEPGAAQEDGKARVAVAGDAVCEERRGDADEAEACGEQRQERERQDHRRRRERIQERQDVVPLASGSDELIGVATVEAGARGEPDPSEVRGGAMERHGLDGGDADGGGADAEGDEEARPARGRRGGWRRVHADPGVDPASSRRGGEGGVTACELSGGRRGVSFRGSRPGSSAGRATDF